MIKTNNYPPLVTGHLVNPNFLKGYLNLREREKKEREKKRKRERERERESQSKKERQREKEEAVCEKVQNQLTNLTTPS